MKRPSNETYANAYKKIRRGKLEEMLKKMKTQTKYLLDEIKRNKRYITEELYWIETNYDSWCKPTEKECKQITSRMLNENLFYKIKLDRLNEKIKMIELILAL